MKYFLVFVTAFLLMLPVVSADAISIVTAAPDSYSLDIQGAVWNHTVLKALIVPAENESWWDPNYLNCTLRAIGQWNDAVDSFSANYSDYAYLNSLTIEPTMLSDTQRGFDIYVNYTEFSLSSSADEVGLTQTYASYKNIIVNATINLVTHSSHGDALNEGDAQNIALHELGHSLGLGHSNYTGDLMYPSYTLLGSAQSVSTLDGYGVAVMFGWLENPGQLYPVRGWLKESQVILPTQIPFEYLPVSATNARPETLQTNPVTQFFVFVFEVLIHPEIAAVVIVAAAVIVGLALFARRQSKSRVKVGS